MRQEHINRASALLSLFFLGSASSTLHFEAACAFPSFQRQLRIYQFQAVEKAGRALL